MKKQKKLTRSSNHLDPPFESDLEDSGAQARGSVNSGWRFSQESACQKGRPTGYTGDGEPRTELEDITTPTSKVPLEIHPPGYTSTVNLQTVLGGVGGVSPSLPQGFPVSLGAGAKTPRQGFSSAEFFARFTIPFRPETWKRTNKVPIWNKAENRYVTRSLTDRRQRQHQELIAFKARASLPLNWPLTARYGMQIVVHRPHRSGDGDWDNYGKQVSDALNGIAWNDDRQVDVATVIKTHGEYTTDVWLWVLP